MLANANSKTDSMPLDRNVREVVAICATHSLSYGEPNDLVGFMRALNENKLLAMNFWSLVARLSDKGGPHPNQPDWILATIVEGVTGRTLDEVRAVGPAHRVLVTRLANMLAGEDVLDPIADVPPTEPVRASDEMLPARKAKQADIAEITPRQSRTAAALASARKSSETAPIEPITNPAWLREERMRLVLEPEQPLRQAQSAPVSTSQDEPPILIPLSSYGETSRDPIFSGGRLVTGLILLLLIACGIWFARSPNSDTIQNFETSIRSGYDSAIASLQSLRTNSSRSSTASSNPSPAAATPVPTTEPSTPLPSPVAVPRTNADATRAPGIPPSPALASRVPQTNRQPAVPAEAPVPRRSGNDEALVAAEASTTDSSPEESTAGRVVVPAATMENNLISSRVPIFPEAAKANGIEGRVVMQAFINKDGSVGHLHVISGDPVLRRAATDAVSTWRYRPYLVNGEPVDVSTTVSVDFFDSN